MHSYSMPCKHKLFTPIQVGDLQLQHRVVLAPLTRCRATTHHVPGHLGPEYYSQRASTPGGLLISEATMIAPKAGGYSQIPGIYTDEQIAAWKKVTDAVHDKSCYIYLQLWAAGRAAEQEVSNKREDLYGGSVERRCRFALELLDAVVNVVGEKKTALRLSPWSPFQDMGMKNPEPTFIHLISCILDRYPNLSYIHLIEPRVSNFDTLPEVLFGYSNDFIRELWAPRPIISAGGYDRESAITGADERGDLIAFGRWFISNPDLPRRLKENIPLSISNRDTYYLRGEVTPLGYTDYPFAELDENN